MNGAPTPEPDRQQDNEDREREKQLRRRNRKENHMSIKIKISSTTEAGRTEALNALKAVIKRHNMLLKVKKEAETGRYMAYVESRKK